MFTNTFSRNEIEWIKTITFCVAVTVVWNKIL